MGEREKNTDYDLTGLKESDQKWGGKNKRVLFTRWEDTFKYKHKQVHHK